MSEPIVTLYCDHGLKGGPRRTIRRFHVDVELGEVSPVTAKHGRNHDAMQVLAYDAEGIGVPVTESDPRRWLLSDPEKHTLPSSRDIEEWLGVAVRVPLKCRTCNADGTRTGAKLQDLLVRCARAGLWDVPILAP